jgi:hypothetical protein
MGNRSPFCICTDSYGNEVPGYKAMFTKETDPDSYNYYCQAQMIGMVEGTTDTKQLYTVAKAAATDKILGFAKSFDGKYINGTGFTNDFFDETSKPYTPNTITTDDAFKSTMPLLFYETLLLYSLMETIEMPTKIDTSNATGTYTCPTGARPVYITYSSYFDSRGKSGFVCMTEDNIKTPIKFIDPDDATKRTSQEVPYVLYGLIDKDGNECKTNVCNIGSSDQFDFDNSPNHYIGKDLFSSGGSISSHESYPMLGVILLILIVVIGLGLYALYYLYMRRHHREVTTVMNNIKPGAGDLAAARANATKSTNRHIMT